MGSLISKTRFLQRHAFGSSFHKGICKVSFGYTNSFKKIAAASATAIHAGITGSFAAQTVTTGITNPDVPRVLTVTPGGTAADIGNGTITINGTNVEGASISDVYQLVDGDTTLITGTKAFKTVTSIVLTATEGTAATFTIGTSARLGLEHRLYAGNTTIKVATQTTTTGTTTIQNAPTINDLDETHVEKNIITLATAPDALFMAIIYYIYDYWSVDTNVNPVYMTSTSTSSTSTSTSTSTFTTSTSSTSTSSTSTSTSSTSSSTSSTSTSTSSTSTSTTTVP